MRFQIGDEVNYKKKLYTVIVNPCRVVELCLSGLYVVDNCNKRWYLHDKDLELIKKIKPFQSKPEPFAGFNTEQIITNTQGGQNSKIDGRYDLLPPLAIKELAKVLEEGINKGYGPWNWLKVEIDEHINHALNHVFDYLSFQGPASKGITIDRIEELSHAFCRLGMALELLLRKV